MIHFKTLRYFIKRILKIRKYVLVTLCILTVIVLFYRYQYLVSTINNKSFADDDLNSSKLVWPEQMPYGDRIREQMNYVPKGYRYEMTPFKRILIENNYETKWKIYKPDQGEFIGCPVSQCWITYNDSMGSDVDAVLFWLFYRRPKYRKTSNQIWILFNDEPPIFSLFVNDADVINWTATYRLDSDIPYPYGYFMKYNSSLPRDSEKNYALHKTKKVAWFVSNCHPNSNRTIYVEELAKHISVDVYGGCGKLKCPLEQREKCFQMLKNDYKFYLSFENSHCIYYITEKFFTNALSNDVLPIVMGPKRSYYELVAPNNSFIHVDDFGSPKELADYLHLLDRDFRLYNEYFRWKNSGVIITDTRFLCRLCAMLHDTNRAPRHYKDVDNWLRGPGVCER